MRVASKLKRLELAGILAVDPKYALMFTCLGLAAQKRTPELLLGVAKQAINKTPVEELPILLAALLAVVPAAALDGTKRKAVAGQDKRNRLLLKLNAEFMDQFEKIEKERNV